MGAALAAPESPKNEAEAIYADCFFVCCEDPWLCLFNAFSKAGIETVKVLRTVVYEGPPEEFEISVKDIQPLDTVHFSDGSTLFVQQDGYPENALPRLNFENRVVR